MHFSTPKRTLSFDGFECSSETKKSFMRKSVINKAGDGQSFVNKSIVIPFLLPHSRLNKIMECIRLYC